MLHHKQPCIAWADRAPPLFGPRYRLFKLTLGPNWTSSWPPLFLLVDLRCPPPPFRKSCLIRPCIGLYYHSKILTIQAPHHASVQGVLLLRIFISSQGMALKVNRRTQDIVRVHFICTILNAPTQFACSSGGTLARFSQSRMATRQ